MVSETDSFFAVSIWSLRWAYCALARSSAAWVSRYLWASLRSLSSFSTWWESSSMMIPTFSRLPDASALSPLARSMSASKLAIPDIESMILRLSRFPIWTMRVTSPCWTRLYPSAEMRALVRRASNSDIVDLRSLT